MPTNELFSILACISEAAGVMPVSNLLELPEMIRRLRVGHDRYEKLRRLNARQFAELYQRNIKGEGTFDELVDQLK